MLDQIFLVFLICQIYCNFILLLISLFYLSEIKLELWHSPYFRQAVLNGAFIIHLNTQELGIESVISL